HRLDQVVGGAQLHAADDRPHVTLGRDDDHRQCRKTLGHLLQDLLATHVRHDEIEEEQGDRLLREHRHHPARVGARLDSLEAVEVQRTLHRAQHRLLVVDDEDGALRRTVIAHLRSSRAAGRDRHTRVPRPTSDSKLRLPPCSSTMRWTMARPRPVRPPDRRVVKNGSVTCVRSSAGMPRPWSSSTRVTRPVCSSEWVASRMACSALSRASQAFITRPTTTCSRRRALPRIAGSPLPYSIEKARVACLSRLLSRTRAERTIWLRSTLPTAFPRSSRA